MRWNYIDMDLGISYDLRISEKMEVDFQDFWVFSHECHVHCTLDMIHC